MKTIIIYASVHHGNTKKLVKSMAEAMTADLVDITKTKEPDISGYDLIGFASGIYFNSFHEEIRNFIGRSSFVEHQKVFLADTCGVAYRDYTAGVRKILEEKGAVCAGSFQCRGYDTYGIFGKLGGIARSHPNARDFKRAQKFCKDILQRQ